MTDSGRRHPRKIVDKPATVEAAGKAFDATVHDISESGAGVSFALDKAPGQLDIGHALELTPAGDGSKPGRVVRHYEGGFGMKFDATAAPEDDK